MLNAKNGLDSHLGTCLICLHFTLLEQRYVCIAYSIGTLFSCLHFLSVAFHIHIHVALNWFKALSYKQDKVGKSLPFLNPQTISSLTNLSLTYNWVDVGPRDMLDWVEDWPKGSWLEYDSF